MIILLQCLAWLAAVTAAQASPYSGYILAPTSRTLRPTTVRYVNGSVTCNSRTGQVECASNLLATSATTADQSCGETWSHHNQQHYGPNSVVFQQDAAITYDFGKNVEGIVSFVVGIQSTFTQTMHVSFSESSLWISELCDATADAGLDAALNFTVTHPGTYTAAPEFRRGAFRYLTIYASGRGYTNLQDLSVHFTAFPNGGNDGIANYTGYFHSNDDRLNRVWYAGAYTTQICSIDPTSGNSLVHLGNISSTDTITYPVTWYNNYTISNGTSVLVDGAKRDRLVWPGDLVVVAPSVFVSTNDLSTLRNGLESLFLLQNSSGALPYAGVPFITTLEQFIGPIFSFTYHLYSIVDLYEYFMYTNDMDFLVEHWDAAKLGLNYSLSFVDETGLQYVTDPEDWLRFGMGGHNIEANAILYYTINLVVSLAQLLNDTASVPVWTTYAAGIKSAANNLLYDASASLYRDNETTTLHPQDGNVWAVFANLTNSPAQNAAISNALRARWGPYGAPAPEAGPTVSPFISSIELRAHLVAGQAQAAIDLIRLMWADFMLDDPRMTNSTFIEGYSTDGSLAYAPYKNNPRVSHAHGWSTGPTSALTFYVAGLQITGPGGSTWSFAPQLGDLTAVQAGYLTPAGAVSVDLSVGMKNGCKTYSFELATPAGTSGQVVLEYPGCAGTVVAKDKDGKMADVSVQVGAAEQGTGKVDMGTLQGGSWTMTFECS